MFNRINRLEVCNNVIAKNGINGNMGWGISGILYEMGSPASL